MMTEILGKIYYRYYNIRNILKHGTNDFFFKVEIETTTFCNRKCHYCPNSKYSRGVHLMDELLFKKIIDELKVLKFDGFIHPHFYGEPLTDKRMPKLLRYAKEQLPKCKIIIFTNGDLLNTEAYNKLNRYVKGFYVTNHGNINKNMPKKKNIKIRNLGRLSTRGNLVDVNNKYTKDSCYLASNILTINYKGDVILCCDDYFGKHSFGNVKKEHIIDIWQKSNFANIRRKLREGHIPLDICRSCFNK